ncbi:hypothetical protein [Streptomyces litchfieldiae]|uniref:Uncharacterized protein n=1 Tax=Streptomyces litchfieldiae TaxID=3075543 RepID=A0ABU2N4S6_9ACTN|nr:hypothetical protein [Streptomyces sp. DSM 44938]MDT0347739.1 hypothetical protein [Streptomyces sp. DSM 44938]
MPEIPQCGTCGKELPRKDRGRPRRYCSAACRTQAYRSRQQHDVEKLRRKASALLAELTQETAGVPPLAQFDEEQLREALRCARATRDALAALNLALGPEAGIRASLVRPPEKEHE